MKTSIYERIRIIAVIALSFVVLNSCTDDDLNSSVHGGNNRIILTLPTDNIVNVNTRATSNVEEVENVLVCITNGSNGIKSELLTDFTLSGKEVSVTLKRLSPVGGDKLHIFCNVDMSKLTSVLDGKSEDNLLNGITSSDALADKVIMYGSASSFESETKITLKRSFAKVALSISESTKLSINSWSIYNLPTDAYITDDIEGYPSGTLFTGKAERLSDVSSPIYMFPRKDNGTNGDNTYLIVHLSNGGWYKLEFQQNNDILPIHLNNAYLFTIKSVTNNGYQNEEEAKANPGSNIVYSMEVTQPNIISNGQYAIQLSKEVVLLTGAPKDALEVLDVSALFTSEQNFNIGTYTVELFNPKGGLTLVDAESGQKKYSVLDKISDITKKHTIKMSISEDVQLAGSYLEIRLGNLVKTVPIRLNAANCYMFDFNSTTDATLKIPVDQANRIKERISDDAVVIPQILWSDQPLVEGTDIILSYSNRSIEIKNKKKFVGNFVVAAIVDNVIKWSWHIWALDASVIEYRDDLRSFDFRTDKVQEYCNKEWMDRNLGAYDLSDLTKAAARGLLYQWGRKDPFPCGNVADDGKLSSQPLEPTLYYGNQTYTFPEGHPRFGASNEERKTIRGESNLEYSIMNPTKFLFTNAAVIGGVDENDPYYHVKFNIDWQAVYWEDVDLTFWQNTRGEKEVYDPCPLGWKVPDGGRYSPWAGIEYDQSINDKEYAVVFNGDIVYPYTPLRGTKELISPKRIGLGSCFWWANQTNEANYYTTYVGEDNGGFSYFYTFYRYYGANVRCVREK